VLHLSHLSGLLDFQSRPADFPRMSFFSGNCWYVDYAFQIVDAQGFAHEVKREWDVDVMQHTAVPKNELVTIG
jgi:hypothetical protein